MKKIFHILGILLGIGLIGLAFIAIPIEEFISKRRKVKKIY